MNSMAREGVTASGAPAISHSGFFLLIDGNGHVRGAYDSGDIQRLDEMIHDARYLRGSGDSASRRSDQGRRPLPGDRPAIAPVPGLD